MPGGADRRRPCQTRATGGYMEALIRNLRWPKSRGRDLGLQQFQTAWSTLRSASWCYPVSAPDRPCGLSEASSRRSLSHATARPKDLYANWATEVGPRSRLKPQWTLASTVHAGQVPAGQGKAWPGEFRGRAKLELHLIDGPSTQLSSQNYRSCVLLGHSINRNSCVQGNPTHRME